ncbi:unnamed protein product [Ceratitis capitata]|uniref:(Mediterranean fruit fly) hypothetical protein n=1 Tax=Ceratitis capitata TaxID=7213 RepID=A0A811VIU7_CERCA|nr:unnamed protein product [Ceratitis capitata]
MHFTLYATAVCRWCSGQQTGMYVWCRKNDKILQESREYKKEKKIKYIYTFKKKKTTTFLTLRTRGTTKVSCSNCENVRENVGVNWSLVRLVRRCFVRNICMYVCKRMNAFLFGHM